MLQSVRYSLGTIQDEARHLVDAGILSRLQPIRSLCKHFPTQEWNWIEQELELNDYSLRDRIGDLMAQEIWTND